MRSRVEQAVTELGFQPSEVGRSLVRKVRRVVGVLVPSVANPVFAASVAGMQDRARAAGHSILIAQSDYDPKREVEAIEALLAERPIGLALTVCDPRASAALDLMRRAGVPTVLVYNEPTNAQLAAVTIDNRRAGRELVRRMLEAGHRRIVFVAGRFAASDRSRLRYEGYRDALKAAGLQPVAAVEVDFISGAEDLDLTETVARYQPTAIVASNDLLALSVIANLRRLGLQVPHDVSVAGFDGIPFGRLIAPSLATIEQPAHAMGVSAVSLLIELAAGRETPRLVRVDHRFRPGDTLGTPADCAPAVHIQSVPSFQER
jgi:DNA-binding LacI/PurR family transcriptional regulator